MKSGFDRSGFTICRVCGVSKYRQRAEYIASKRFQYRDESGRLWSKRCCPDCDKAQRNAKRWASGKNSPRQPKKVKVRKGRWTSPTGSVPCRDCGETKPRVRAGETSSGVVRFKDDKGRSWYKMRCPDCARVYRHKSGGYRKCEELTDHKNAKGFAAERHVANHFRAQGYEVVQTEAHGPDLTLEKDGVKLTCEVKSTITSSVGGKTFYFATPVYPNRRNDDMVAVVMPDTSIIIEPMKDYLNKCSPNGRRQLTREVRASLGEAYFEHKGPKRRQYNPMAKI